MENSKAVSIVVIFLLTFTCILSKAQAQSAQTNTKSPVSEIRFVGNKFFTNEELAENLKQCLGDEWQVFDAGRYEYYVQKCSLELLFSKGFAQAKVAKIKLETSSNGIAVMISVEEGIRFRLGKIKVEGLKIFSPKQFLEMSGQKEGEYLDSRALSKFMYDTLTKTYQDQGYLQMDADAKPEFVMPQAEEKDGIVNLSIYVEEGMQFRISKIVFSGIEASKADRLKRILAIKEGEIYSREKFEKGIETINKRGEYDFIDKDKDVRFQADEETNDLYLKISIRSHKFSEVNLP